MKRLQILVLTTVLLVVIFGLSRVPHQSSNLSHNSAALLAQSEIERSLSPDEKEASPSAKQPPSIHPTGISPPQTASQSTTPARVIIASAWKTEQQPELTAFAQWTDRFLAAADAERAGLISDGVELAKQRRVVLAQLVRSDPERVLAVAVPLGVRTRLPDEITNVLEKRVSGRGQLSLIGVTPAPGQQVAEAVFRTALVNRQEYRAFTYGRRSRLATLPDASIIGIAVDGALAVSDSPLRLLESGEEASGRTVENVCVISGKVTPVDTNFPLNVTEPTAVEVNGQVQVLCEAAHVILYENRLAANESVNVAIAADGQPGSSTVVGRPTQAWTHGTKKVLIIRVDFSDLPGTPITEDEAVNLFNDVNGVRDYYQQGSFGKTSLQILPTTAGDSPDVTDVLRMSRTAAGYATNGSPVYGDTIALHGDARAAAQASGYLVDTYDFIGVIFSGLGGNPGSLVTYAGAGELGGKNFWIHGSYDFRVVTHEIGHNYGIWHANLWQVSDGNPGSDTGVNVEYGDNNDIMGTGGGIENHFTHWNKSILQWIPDTAIPVITNSGIYRIYRFDHQNANLSNTLALKIVRDGTRDYWIGYRRATDNVNLNNGAYILWGYNNNQGGHLLDMTTPGNDIEDAALAIGATFIDPVANVTVRPVAQGGVAPDEYLDVQVTFGPISPVVVAEPQDQIVTPGQGAVFLVQANGIPLPSYQWQRQANGTTSWDNLTDGSEYSGTRSAALIVNGTTVSMDGDKFRCIFSNSTGVENSLPAILTVLPFGVTTLAGQVSFNGNADGIALITKFAYPSGVAVDAAGNIYVADKDNFTIRKITPARVVTTLAGSAGQYGSADGTGTAARFTSPKGVAVDSANNVYVADLENHTIRKITPAGDVTTLAGSAGQTGSADGTNTAARFNYPRGVAVDSAGNVYVADYNNQTIRKITPAGVVTTLAGSAGQTGSADGTGSAARFTSPSGVAVDTAGNVYVADEADCTIRKITPARVVTTLAGSAGQYGSTDGTGTAARFFFPNGVAVDSAGNVYVGDTSNNTVRKVTSAGVVTTLAGSAGQTGSADGTNSAARFYGPKGVAVDSAGNVYVADYGNHTIRKIVFARIPQLAEMALSNGVFQFVLNGSIGSSYAIQISSNLVSWSTISTNTIPVAGTVLIVDPNMTDEPRRFYRAVTQPPADPLFFPVISGVVTAPFVSTNGYIYQSILTGVANGGRAVYDFTIANAGTYVIQTMVNAANGSANSFYVNIDAEPQDPYMVWDIPLTLGFEQRTVSWLGISNTTNEFDPKVFNLAQGPHQLIIRGREADTLLESLAIVATNFAPIVSAITQTPGDVGSNAPGTQAYAATQVQYSASASDPNGSALTWQWIYQVNGEPEVLYQSGSGTVPTIGFDYAMSVTGSNYVWTLRVSNTQATSQSQLAVSVVAPVVPPSGLTIPAPLGIVSAPFIITNGYIYQPVLTSVTSGGRAAYNFTITNLGTYVIQAMVNAPNGGANSFYVNIDVEPQNPYMIWGIPLTLGFEQRTVSWLGNGTSTSEFVPKVFTLTPGTYQLIIRGREGNALLQSITILPYGNG